MLPPEGFKRPVKTLINVDFPAAFGPVINNDSVSGEQNIMDGQNRLYTVNKFMKDEITFEILEGRRSYLQKLCAQIIATANIKLGRGGLND